jgi:uncharacterized protein
MNRFLNSILEEPSSHPVPSKSHMKRIKIAAGSLAAVIVVWLIGCAVAGVISADWALHPERLALTSSGEAQASAIAAADHAVLQQASITAEDGALLRAWFIRPESGNGDAVILLHGQADNRVGMLGPADLLLRHGYSVLLPDSRAQGMSGGDIATYGIKEADDIRDWFDWLMRTQSPRCVDGLGNSMGAAQILQSLGTESGFCAVVAESPFASFREASYDRIGEWFGLAPRIAPWLGRTIFRPVVDFGFLYARLRYGVNLAEDDPAAAVATSSVPVLLIDGLLDDNLPPRNDEIILAESHGRNLNVLLWEPANAGHVGVFSADPQEYKRRVIGWFAGHQRRR